FRHVLEDIESLNKKATEGRYELTAVSYHAYPYIADKYVLMASGSSVGDGYGPLLVSLGRTAPRELKGKRIAIPGTMTTAFLALKLFEPEFEPVVMPFDKILDAVKDHQVDAGLIIHEGQLTYGHGGLHSIIDLGQWFRSQHNLPLPLGANALRRDLPKDIQAECSRMMRASIQHSLDHREEALNYAMQFARDLDPALADQFVGMYVNHHTVDGGEVVPRAAQKLLDLGYEAGLIPQKVTIEVVR
ncbi:MAG: ABC transporter substrate-binding protein, partial [Acidobacteriaceae bacterium]|nr:ABC transporter substrate-binding protein [Acidobacteriaceae bacterium]